MRVAAKFDGTGGWGYPLHDAGVHKAGWMLL